MQYYNLGKTNIETLWKTPSHKRGEDSILNMSFARMRDEVRRWRRNGLVTKVIENCFVTHVDATGKTVIIKDFPEAHFAS